MNKDAHRQAAQVLLLEAVTWCRARNAMVRFESDGTVSVKVNGMTRRRQTLPDAVDAMARARDDMELDS